MNEKGEIRIKEEKSRLPVDVRGSKTSVLKLPIQILAGLVKMNEQDKHEDIEKKLDIFHILNGILAKTRNIIF